MAWHGKPSGGYPLHTTEGDENAYEMHYMLQRNGYTLEAQAGIIGNVMAESALNVWRWQDDSVNLLYGGYGLFQYTASNTAATDRYIEVCQNLPYYAPNLSTSSVTAGALVTDAICQMNVFMTDYLHKWVGTIWRSYWSEDRVLRQKINNILSTWGNGSYLTMEQFKLINDIESATIAFLGAFEGPAVPNYSPRVSNAQTAYQVISGAPPTPTPTSRGKMPIWMMLKPYYRR